MRNPRARQFRPAKKKMEMVNPTKMMVIPITSLTSPAVYVSNSSRREGTNVDEARSEQKECSSSTERVHRVQLKGEKANTATIDYHYHESRSKII